MKGIRSGNILLAIQRDTLLNAVRGIFASRRIETIILAIAALAWLTYQFASAYAAVAHCARCTAAVQTNPAATLAALTAIALIAGLAAGGLTAERLHATTSAAWLTTLPWPAAARRADFRQAFAAIGLIATLAVGATAATTLHALHFANQSVATVILTTAYAAGFRLRRGAVHPRPPKQAAAPETAPNRRQTLLDCLDSLTPAYASRWAWSGHLRFIAIAAILLLIPFGGASATVSLTRHQTAASFGIAVAGANLIFLFALRPAILGSTVLRTAPLTYVRALAAVLRAPLLLSCGWFALVATVPLATDAASWRMLPGMAAALLFLNALYATCAAFRPASPRQAKLLYGAGLYAVIYETATGGIPYGALTLAVIAGFAALLMRRARQDWRAFLG
jgi:hypothetical protein